MNLLEVLSFVGTDPVRSSGFADRLATAGKADPDILQHMAQHYAGAFPASYLGNEQSMIDLAEELGIDDLPVPIDSLRDVPATQSILEGRSTLNFRRVRSRQARKAAEAIQSALIKIGAHYPGLDVETRQTLLMLPDGADARPGKKTRKALQAALGIAAGSADDASSQSSSNGPAKLDQRGAKAIEKLLKHADMPPLDLALDPRNFIDGEPGDCVYIGFLNNGKWEARFLTQHMARSGVRLETLVEETDEGPTGFVDKGKTYDLRSLNSIYEVIDDVLRPPPTTEKREEIAEFLWQMPATHRVLDEMIQLLIAFHQAAHGRRRLEMLILSGHHMTSPRVDNFGMITGQNLAQPYQGVGPAAVPEDCLVMLARIYPEVAQQIGFVMYPACYRLRHTDIIREFIDPDNRDWTHFARFRENGDGVAIGYHHSAPGSWAGGIPQILAAVDAYRTSRIDRGGTGFVTGKDYLEALEKIGKRFRHKQSDEVDYAPRWIPHMNIANARTGHVIGFRDRGGGTGSGASYIPRYDRLTPITDPTFTDKPRAGSARSDAAKARRDEARARNAYIKAERHWRRHVLPILAGKSRIFSFKLPMDLRDLDRSRPQPVSDYLELHDEAIDLVEALLTGQQSFLKVREDVHWHTFEGQRVIAENMLDWPSSWMPEFIAAYSERIEKLNREFAELGRDFTETSLDELSAETFKSSDWVAWIEMLDNAIFQAQSHPDAPVAKQSQFDAMNVRDAAVQLLTPPFGQTVRGNAIADLRSRFPMWPQRKLANILAGTREIPIFGLQLWASPIDKNVRSGTDIATINFQARRHFDDLTFAVIDDLADNMEVVDVGVGKGLRLVKDAAGLETVVNRGRIDVRMRVSELNGPSWTVHAPLTWRG